jgi:ferritin-like metal-binding protein YciE
MAQTSNDVIRRYLEDAIAAEKSFETQLQGFAREGDDEEVEAAFAIHAAETRRQYERLITRLEELGGSPSTTKSFLAHVFGLAPKSAQVGHAPEERTTQNLIMAFTVENSECAMYEALAAAAEAAGDEATEKLAREIQADEKQTADKVWRFIASRSKNAFNLLTSTETDPSVNTRAADNRLI